MKIINFEKTKNEVMNKRTAKIIGKCQNLLYCIEKFEDKYIKDKMYCKLTGHCHYTGD